jgi:hypothetical protein
LQSLYDFMESFLGRCHLAYIIFNNVLHTSQKTLFFKRVSGVHNYMAYYLSRTATLQIRLQSLLLL